MAFRHPPLTQQRLEWRNCSVLVNSTHLEVEFHAKELHMKKSKFTEEQMAWILKEIEAGAKIAETSTSFFAARMPKYKALD